jgi:hypothetical protein
MGKIRQSGGRLTGKEIALVGTILGYGSCAFWFVFLVAGFVLYRQDMKETGADEASAVGAIRQINDAEATYSRIYASSSTPHSYAGSMATLGPALKAPALAPERVSTHASSAALWPCRSAASPSGVFWTATSFSCRPIIIPIVAL